MPTLELKPTHKPVLNYYAALRQFEELGVRHELAVRSAFQNLLDHCAKQRDWTLVPEWEIRRPRQHSLRVDGALVDDFRLTNGFWEAKDIGDDLRREARRKFDAGYPGDNILFQTPRRALLFQNGELVFEGDLTQPPALIDTLNFFFGYTQPAFDDGSGPSGSFRSAFPSLPTASSKSSSASERPTSDSFRHLQTFPTSPGARLTLTSQMPPLRRC